MGGDRQLAAGALTRKRPCAWALAHAATHASPHVGATPAGSRLRPATATGASRSPRGRPRTHASACSTARGAPIETAPPGLSTHVATPLTPEHPRIPPFPPPLEERKNTGRAIWREKTNAHRFAVCLGCSLAFSSSSFLSVLVIVPPFSPPPDKRRRVEVLASIPTLTGSSRPLAPPPAPSKPRRRRRQESPSGPRADRLRKKEQSKWGALLDSPEHSSHNPKQVF